MTKSEVIAHIAARLSQLSEERVHVFAEIVDEWSGGGNRPEEDQATRRAIANGIAEARRGEFASDSEIAEAYARFRS